MSLSLGIGLGLTMQRGGGLSAYAVLAQYEPPIVWDFLSTEGNHGTGYFRKGNVEVAFADLFDPTFTGNATVTDSDGFLKWRAHNLFLNSAIAVTQGVTVISGPDYTLAFKGTGSITYSGAASGTLNGTGADDLVAVEIATSTTTLTCTVTGSVTVCRVYRSDLGGMQNNPDRTDDLTYVETAGSAVFARRNEYVYDGVSAWDGPYCWVEPEAATNLCNQSNSLGSGNWSIGSTDSVTITADQATGPDGNTSLAKVAITDTTSENHQVAIVPVLAADTTYAMSVVVEDIDQRYVALSLYGASNNWATAVFDLTSGIMTSAQTGSTSGTIIATNIKYIGGGRYRISLAAQVASVTAIEQFGLSFVTAAVPTLSNVGLEAYVGVAGVGVYAGFADLVASSVPSAHIPTSGSTMNRELEALPISAANLASVVNTVAMSIQMDGLWDYADTGSTVELRPFDWFLNSTNYVRLTISTATSRTGQPTFESRTTANADNVVGSTTQYSAGLNVPFNVASRHTSSALNGSLEGVALTENATPTDLADLSTADFDVAVLGSHKLGKGRIWGGVGGMDITDPGMEEASTP